MPKTVKLFNVEVGVERSYDEIEAFYVPQLDKNLWEENHAVFTTLEKATEWMQSYVKRGVLYTYGLLWTTDYKLYEGDLEEIERSGAFDDMEQHTTQPILIFTQKTMNGIICKSFS